MAAPRKPNTEAARAASLASRAHAALRRKAEAAIDTLAEISGDPNLDGSDRVALDDARAVLDRYIT